MRLKYLREDPNEPVIKRQTSHTGKKPISKKQFFILLALNLILWLCVAGFYLEFSPASILNSMKSLSQQSELVVTGVVCNSKMQAAIISDEIYKVGDTIKGYKVVEINKHGVEFMKGEKQITKKVTSHNNH